MSLQLGRPTGASPDTVHTGTPKRSAARPAVAVGLVLCGLALLGVLAAALVVGGGRPQPPAPGLSDGGPAVGWGLHGATLAVRVAAVVTVGALALAALLAPGRGRLVGDGAAGALRAASLGAAAWALAETTRAVLELCLLVGAGPTGLTTAALRTYVVDLVPGRTAAAVVALALVVAVVAASSRSRAAAGGLLGVALVAVVLPAVLTGHSADSGDHLLAVSTLSVHVAAATLWVGGLLALVVHARGLGDLARAADRFSALALGCFLAVGLSGALAGWLVLGATVRSPQAVIGSGYGILLVTKTAALALLGALGWWHRRRTLPALHAGAPRAFRRLAAGEVALMLATLAVAVGLAASPPPAPPATSVPADRPAASGPADDAAGSAEEPQVEDMSGHDHGELSVGILVDDSRFHVAAAMDPGQVVTVFNGSDTDVTLTADDGSFDLEVRARTLTTFTAPTASGPHPFTSRHPGAGAGFADVLLVR